VRGLHRSRDGFKMPENSGFYSSTLLAFGALRDFSDAYPLGLAQSPGESPEASH
jgi:hypothetical protein